MDTHRQLFPSQTSNVSSILNRVNSRDGVISSEQDEHQMNNIFTATIGSVLSFITILSPLLVNNNENQTCNVIISKDFMHFTTDLARVLNISTSLPSIFFHEYSFPKGLNDKDELIFSVNLKLLLNCLSIFGSSNSKGVSDTSLQEHFQTIGPKTFQQERIDKYLKGYQNNNVVCKLQFDNSLRELNLIVEDISGNIITTCHLSTGDAESFANLLNEFVESQILAKVIVQSECLLDVLESVDTTIEHLRFSFYDGKRITESLNLKDNSLESGPANTMSIKGMGSAGEFEAELIGPSNVIDEFFIEPLDNSVSDDNKIVSFRYDIKLISFLLKPLCRAKTTSIRVNTEGLLSARFLMPTKKANIFVEFLLTPSVDY